MTPYYKINGLNILPFIEDKGLSWEENDIDDANTGRSMDGIMDRAVVARKDKHIIRFRTLDLSEMRVLMNATTATFVTVQTNIHPKRMGDVTLIMYNSSRKGAVFSLTDDTEAAWDPEPLDLIER